MNKRNTLFVWLLVATAASFLAGCAAPSATFTPVVPASPTDKPSTPTTPTNLLTPIVDNPNLVATVTVNLVAQNNAFDKDLIRVNSGDVLSLVFENRDSTDHNFSIYENAASLQPLFKGKALTGPGTITYTFLVPAVPNDYRFQCDFHPATMNGRFTVTGNES